MSRFTGSECIICNETFNDNDDIVVCPECGTPYHRECYLKENKCVNTKLHEENKSWSQNQDEQNNKAGKKCSHCNLYNKEHALICENCGEPLVDNLNFGNEKQNMNNANPSGNKYNNNFAGFNFDPDDKYCGIDPEEAINEDVNFSDAVDFIGSNTPYYLINFKRMKETGKKISLNIICIFLPQFYFANRKMWLASIATILLMSILYVPSCIYTLAYLEESNIITNSIDVQSRAFEMIVQLTNYAMMGIRVITCLFANWLYYRHMLKKIKTIKNNTTDKEQTKAKIQKSGGTSFFFILVALAIQMAAIGAVTWILINI